MSREARRPAATCPAFSNLELFVKRSQPVNLGGAGVAVAAGGAGVTGAGAGVTGAGTAANVLVTVTVALSPSPSNVTVTGVALGPLEAPGHPTVRDASANPAVHAHA